MNSLNEYISIIVPHYNSSLLIHKLLDSLMIEEKKNLEIIIVDDKSEKVEFERLSRIIKKYTLNIKLLKNDGKKKGAGVCRNIGLQNATGRWVLFADSDDYFKVHFYDMVFPYLNSSYDIVYFVPTSEDEKGNNGKRHEAFLEAFHRYYKRNGDETGLRYEFPVVWSKLFKRDFIVDNKIEFDSTIISNDVMFSVKSSYYASKVAVDKNSIYCWSYNSESITTKMHKEKFNVLTDVFIKKNSFFKNKLLKAEYKKVSTSAIKVTSMSLIRYKFGVKYTVQIYIKLICNGIPPFKTTDFKLNKIKRFLNNGKFYKLSSVESE